MSSLCSSLFQEKIKLAKNLFNFVLRSERHLFNFAGSLRLAQEGCQGKAGAQTGKKKTLILLFFKIAQAVE